MLNALSLTTPSTLSLPYSNNTLLQEAAESFKTRAVRNGYSPQYLNRVKSKPKKTPKHQSELLLTLTIPYISSAFTNNVYKVVKRRNLDIRLVQRPQSSLKIFSSNQDLTTKHARILVNATSVGTRHQHLQPTVQNDLFHGRGPISSLCEAYKYATLCKGVIN